MVHLPHTVAAHPDAPALRIEGLTIRRGRAVVLDAFSWEHHPGAVAWLVGENGTGKSSLLRVLAGRHRTARGRVQHRAPNGTWPRRLYYRPEMRLPAGATVADWRRLTATLLGAPPALSPGSTLEPPDLPGRRRLDHLSTGQAKRLLLDALLRQSAPFVYLDEPFEHLSAAARATLEAILVQRARVDVVVVGTNQTIPAAAGPGPVLRMDGDRVIIAHTREDA